MRTWPSPPCHRRASLLLPLKTRLAARWGIHPYALTSTLPAQIGLVMRQNCNPHWQLVRRLGPDRAALSMHACARTAKRGDRQGGGAAEQGAAQRGSEARLERLRAEACGLASWLE